MFWKSFSIKNQKLSFCGQGRSQQPTYFYCFLKLSFITGVNIAYRKPANQSTTVRGGSALNANDGDKSTEHDGKRCSETFKETSPWWQVDLLKPYPVKVIRIITRGCCGHQPLQDLEIRVGNSSTDLQKNPLCAWFPGTIGEFFYSSPLLCQYLTALFNSQKFIDQI